VVVVVVVVVVIVVRGLVVSGRGSRGGGLINKLVSLDLSSQAKARNGDEHD